MLNWTQLVAERDEWVTRNFPPYDGEVPGLDSILGCIEEAGELAHAHLKAKQGIRGSQEEHDAAARDAIGDIIVYLMGVMSAHVNPTKVPYPRSAWRTSSAEQAVLSIGEEVGRLACAARFPTTESTWLLSINDLVTRCAEYCAHRGWDFDQIVTDTWNHVKQRDWVAHREAGAPASDPAMTDPVVPAA